MDIYSDIGFHEPYFVMFISGARHKVDKLRKPGDAEENGPPDLIPEPYEHKI